jgi:glutathione peroxidase
MRLLISTILLVSSLIGANMKTIYDIEVETIDGTI